MKYLIAILLPPFVAEPIAQLQQQYKPERWRIRVAPHVTLIHRGDLLVAEPTLRATLAGVALDFQPFPIDLKGVDTFRSRSVVIYAKMTHNPVLTDLQARLFEAVEPLFTSDTPFSNRHEYHPHVTLANRLTPEEAAERLPRLRKIEINFNFLCENFTLLRLSPNDATWQTIATFTLDCRIPE